MGLHNASQEVCGHCVLLCILMLAHRYPINFNRGLATFLTQGVAPTSSLEFGCGLGLYADYIARSACHVVIAP